MSILNTKLTSLRNMINKSISCNQSPTNRAKLVSINKYTATMEVTPSQYGITEPNQVGKQFSIPTFVAWNCYFF